MATAYNSIRYKLSDEAYSPSSTNVIDAGGLGGGPDFRTSTGDDALTALANRRAARLNASAISPKEYESFLKERKDLVKKKYAEGIDAKEKRRLAFVDWSLDRIEDAKFGHALDRLEGATALYEKVGRDVQGLIGALNEHSTKGKRR